MIAKRARLIYMVVCVVVVAPISTARSQTDTTVTAAPTASMRSLCWRPRPGPVCRAYVPTEFAYEHPVSSTSSAPGGFQEDDFDRRLVLSLGLMRNHGTRSAFGGLFATSTEDSEGFGLLRAEGRYRRWIGSRAGLDLGLGLAQKDVYSENGIKDVRARGLTAGVGVDFGYVGIDARVDRLRGGGRSQNGAFVGVHAGAQAAPAAAGVLAAVTVIALIAWIAGS